MVQPLGYTNEEYIARNNKTIHFIERSEKTTKLVQYDCKIKEEVSTQDILAFNQFLYSMKLDSNFSSNSLLKEGKITFDLISEFNQILTSKEKSVDFGGVLSLIRSEELIQTAVVQEPVRHFLNLFEFSKRKELPIQDYVIIDRFSIHPSFIGTDESEKARTLANSIASNTKILKYHLLQTDLVSSKECQGKEAVMCKHLSIAPVSSNQKANQVG